MSRKLRVLFVHARLWPYVEKDLRILQERYEVRELLFSGTRRSLPALARGVRWADITFCWFAKLHAFYTVLLSRAFGKRSIVVTGGDDVANWTVNGRPYGVSAHPLKRWFPRTTCRLADRVLAVSRFNLEEAIRNTGVSPDRATLVYHGFDSAYFNRPAHVRKDGSVIAVSQVTWENVHRKGLRLFVEAARYLPQVPFHMVGMTDDDSVNALKRVATPNVNFPGARYDQELVQTFATASVVVQPSEWESFGAAVAEGMLCECVPVVTRVCALPEVVGDCGVYVQERTPEALARGISDALQQPEMGPRARQRIMDCFPLEKRRRELLEAVEQMASSGR